MLYRSFALFLSLIQYNKISIAQLMRYLLVESLNNIE